MNIKNAIEKKSWSEFYETGLLLFVNHFLHIFGWAIVFDIDESKKVYKVYPARVKFRGFDYESTDTAYKAISKYMASNYNSLMNDVNYENAEPLTPNGNEK